MSRLLFEEPLVKNPHYMKNFRLEKAVYLAVGFPFLAMALLCLGYSLYGLSVAMFALFITMMVYWRGRSAATDSLSPYMKTRSAIKKPFRTRRSSFPWHPRSIKFC